MHAQGREKVAIQIAAADGEGRLCDSWRHSMRRPAAVATLTWLCVLGLASAQEPKPLTDWVQGRSNHFGGPNDAGSDPLNPMVSIGGCSYGELDPTVYPFYNILSVEPSSELVSGLTMNGCGTCFEIQCSDSPDKCNNAPLTNSVVATIAGTCIGGCGGAHVNLHIFAFDQLAPIRLGNIGIRLRQVECAPNRNLVVRIKVYRVDEGGYIKFVVMNIPFDGGLRSVRLKASSENDSWQSAENLFGAAWEASVLPVPPLDIQVTNTKGEEVILKEIIKDPGFVGDVESNVQFSGAEPVQLGAPEVSPPSQTVQGPDPSNGPSMVLPRGTPSAPPDIPGGPVTGSTIVLPGQTPSAPSAVQGSGPPDSPTVLLPGVAPSASPDIQVFSLPNDSAMVPSSETPAGATDTGITPAPGPPSQPDLQFPQVPITQPAVVEIVQPPDDEEDRFRVMQPTTEEPEFDTNNDGEDFPFGIVPSGGAAAGKR